MLLEIFKIIRSAENHAKRYSGSYLGDTRALRQMAFNQEALTTCLLEEATS